MKFAIEGGQKLSGEISVAGMKNAATPIIAATLLTEKECIIKNVPRITDVDKMLEILRSIGGKADWTADNEITIQNKDLKPQGLNSGLVKSLRSSVLFLGSFIARLKTIELDEPGGCIIGNRPLDTHLLALQKLGADIQTSESTYTLKSNGLKGSTIVLQEASVTATENVLMAASTAKGTTVIKNAAMEPHVQDLCKFLKSIGANIKGEGTPTITITGVDELSGTTHTIIPDTIEAGTFIILAIATRSRMVIRGVDPSHMDVVLEKLKDMGATLDIRKDSVAIEPSLSLNAAKIKAQPYPAIPTDLQSLFGVLATQCTGTSLVHDTLFEGRMSYVNELIKMGASATLCDPHRVLITGPTPLYAREITSFDLRAGAAMIIAALLAEGKTVIHQAEIVDRGYEKIDERLKGIGANIERQE